MFSMLNLHLLIIYYINNFINIHNHITNSNYMINIINYNTILQITFNIIIKSGFLSVILPLIPDQ